MLKYADMWDMPLGNGDPNEIPHWAGNILWVVLGAICKVCWRYRVDNRQNLRAFKGHGCVVVCNHTSFVDGVFMCLCERPSQWIRFMGRDTLFDNAGGLLGQIISRVGAFPVKRDSADRTSIKRATNYLKTGQLVGIMPEGTRRGKSDRTPELHSGAAFVAQMGKAPILPMTVRNAEKVKQKGKFVRFPKITIEYGAPVLLEDFDFLPKTERLDGCSWYAMRECFALFYNIPAEQVNMAELFPESVDYSQTFAEHPIPKHTSEEVVAMLDAQGAAKAAKIEKCDQAEKED